jgi:hypothetical protein
VVKIGRKDYTKKSKQNLPFYNKKGAQDFCHQGKRKMRIHMCQKRENMVCQFLLKKEGKRRGKNVQYVTSEE